MARFEIAPDRSDQSRGLHRGNQVVEEALLGAPMDSIFSSSTAIAAASDASSSCRWRAFARARRSA
jgi:hypothetical protein